MSLLQRISYWARTVLSRKRDVARRRKQAIKARREAISARGQSNAAIMQDRYSNALRRYDDSKKALAKAEANLAKIRRQQAATGKPRIVASGIVTRPVFGGLGPELKVTTHYAASPRAKNLAEGLKLARQFNAFHAGKGWGGLSYHFLIPDTGEIILGRPVTQKGAHVLNTNSNNVGINFFCTTSDKPTEAQKKAVRWLVANAHTSAMPKSHRTARDLRNADTRGHKFWPGQSTGCPGYFTPDGLGIK